MKPLKFVLIATIGLLLGGCSQANLSDLQAYTAEVQQLPAPPLPPAPEIPELERVSYSGKQARDPFIQTAMRAQTQTISAASCPQPNVRRVRHPLESFALDQLTFSGTIRNGDDGYLALLISNEGRLYRVKRGDYIGIDQGEVIAISPDQIVLNEWISTGDGCWQRRETKINLLTAQGSSE
ncbi:pilus assembly protein PilP [Pseudidiomarina taiwanensis]|uniref:Pilus assembly protein PilQ n=1 Tax=Pseudidiomarina taiwanensis TaxID=337250 RepID=A0A432ZFJ4_9GAMM|nr:pilus assembly protein PilP [Pseudidiomarina taiwanensis]RUO76660.1 pilus assembly protein PilQ [Pseudidiomarina taiwanensis]